MRVPPPLLLIAILSSLRPVHSQTNIGQDGAATGTTLVSTYTMTRTVLRVVESVTAAQLPSNTTVAYPSASTLVGGSVGANGTISAVGTAGPTTGYTPLPTSLSAPLTGDGRRVRSVDWGSRLVFAGWVLMTLSWCS
ncbi:hypothetical protein LTR66_004556 [Elasticomyces elasticus]|nr:hypothetical protein LTR50_004865 [Elasticomyces elasticus]KAK4995676.1 hypothetical protein LTR66_004556 [Elasticomyces elasticus]